MSQKYITVLESLGAPPRADFLCADVRTGLFDEQELLDLFGWACVDATCGLALEYIDSGSILVLPSRREPYLHLLARFAAVRNRQKIPPVVLGGACS